MIVSGERREPGEGVTKRFETRAGLWHSIKPPNERMQLTWLIGAPSRPVSVHELAVGRIGLGSPATQLMRAVSWHDKAGVSSPVWRPVPFELSS